MSPTRRIVLYSIMRLVLFAVPFIVFELLGIWWWLSAITAAVVATCLSYLFLNRQRHQVAEAVSSLRTKAPTDTENELENEAIDLHGSGSD